MEPSDGDKKIKCDQAAKARYACQKSKRRFKNDLRITDFVE